jgi:putative phosphoesterase
MTARVAVLSDIHGNAVALEAVRAAIRSEAPDAVLVCGDLAFNGPDPCAAVDAVREMESEGALVIAGNTDVAVADFDWAAAFPWFPEGPPSSFVAAAEWAHVELGTERVDWLRRLPSERRLHVEGAMLLACHASPGSQTAGFDADLDPTVVLDRIMRTEARVICCGHTHLPEVRDFGWKMIVNDGSAGYIFDGEPTASWALVTLDGESVSVDIRRTEFDALTVANAISERGLPGDVYRAATVRTGKLVR